MSFAVKSLDHVEVYVSDLAVAARWYEQVLGLKEMARWDPEPVMIGAGGTKLALFRSQGQPAKSGGELSINRGWRRVAWLTDAAGFDLAQKHLAALGIRFVGPEDHVVVSLSTLQTRTTIRWRSPSLSDLSAVAQKLGAGTFRIACNSQALSLRMSLASNWTPVKWSIRAGKRLFSMTLSGLNCRWEMIVALSSEWEASRGTGRRRTGSQRVGRTADAADLECSQWTGRRLQAESRAGISPAAVCDESRQAATVRRALELSVSECQLNRIGSESVSAKRKRCAYFSG